MIAPNDWQRELGESNRLALAQAIFVREVEERLTARRQGHGKFFVVVWIHKLGRVIFVTTPLTTTSCITSSHAKQQVRIENVNRRKGDRPRHDERHGLTLYQAPSKPSPSLSEAHQKTPKP